jgi:replicative DNA helicase
MSILLEQKILAQMSNAQEVSRIWEMGLRSEVFEEPLNQAVFNFIIEYWQTNEMRLAPTRDVLVYEFPGVHIAEEVEESTIWLVEALQRRFATNKLQNILRSAAVTSAEDPMGTLRKLWGEAYSASETVAPRFDRVNMADTVEDRRQRYGLREENRGVGMTLGIPALDQHTNGLLPGELAAVGAFSKVGKTVFLIHAATQARRQGFTPVVFTLEMSIPEIEDRIDAFYSQVSYNRLTHGELTMQEMQTLRAAQSEMSTLGPLYVEKPERGERTVRNLTNRARQLGADYMIIDQLSFLDPENGHHRDLTSKHSEIIFDLKAEISREAAGAIPCLLAVQLNRASLQQDNGIGLQNFANTSSIEQTVDIALGLSRTREERANRVMRLDILGARRSDIRSWLLRWELHNSSRIDVLEEVR